MTTNFPSGLDAFTNPSATDAMDSVTVPHATQHADLNDAVEALQAKVGVDGSAVTTSLDYKLADLGTWTTYTPVLTAQTTNPNLGSTGAISGYYTQVNDLVVGTVYLYFSGTGVSAGNGVWFISLPVAADTSGPNIIAGHINCYDSSVPAFRHGFPQHSTSTTVQMYASDNVSIAISNSSPFAWSTNDQLRMQFIYKAA